MKRFFHRLRFWLFRPDKNCKRCCLFCKLYRLCSLQIFVESAQICEDNLKRFAAVVSEIGQSANRLRQQQKDDLKEGEQNEVVT